MKEKIFFIIRVAAGALFVISGFSKLVQPYQNFLAVMDRFEVVGGAASIFLSRAIPWGELIVGIFLIAGLWVRYSAVILGGFSVLFFGVIASALVRKLPIQECGCFGENFSLPIQKTIILDCFLMITFALLYWMHDAASWLSLDRFYDGRDLSKKNRSRKK